MSTQAKAFATKMGLRFPAIIQAPMAGGVTTPIPSYPIPHYLTKTIRVEAAKQGNKALMSLWCGENIAKLDVTLDSADTLLHKLWEECANT